MASVSLGLQWRARPANHDGRPVARRGQRHGAVILRDRHAPAPTALDALKHALALLLGQTLDLRGSLFAIGARGTGRFALEVEPYELRRIEALSGTPGACFARNNLWAVLVCRLRGRRI